MQRVNNLMADLIKRYRPEPCKFEAIELESKVQELIASGFVVLDGCTYLRACVTGRRARKVLASLQLDQTGREAFINKFHLADFVSKASADSSYMTVQMLKALTFLTRQLKQHDCNHLYAVTVSASEQFSSSDFDFVIRFYRIRDDEPPYHDENLESFHQPFLMHYV